MNIQIVETERRRAEHRKKREVDEPVSDLESSLDKEEELKDRSSSSSSLEESELGEREDTTFQLDPVEDLES